jgi:hypothetical protein
MNRILALCLAACLSCAALADNHEPPTVYGQYYAIAVNDPEALVAAMQKYRASATGQKLTSNVTLSASIANGDDQATHTVTVFYPSAAAFQADMQASMGSSDRAEFLAAINAAADVETENVFTQTRGRINDEGLGGPGVATMLFGLTVTNAGQYNAALDKIMNSAAAGAFPGNMFSGQIIAMGDQPGTHWVSFQAKDMGALLSGVEAFMASKDFADYAKNANQFRRVEGRYISAAMLTLTPQ